MTYQEALEKLNQEFGEVRTKVLKDLNDHGLTEEYEEKIRKEKQKILTDCPARKWAQVYKILYRMGGSQSIRAQVLAELETQFERRKQELFTHFYN